MPIGWAARGSIGAAKKDDGVLLLVAPNERKVWIATGYGAGGFLTDAMSGIIVREDILPQFKQNRRDYGGGIVAGADAIIKQMCLPPDEAQRECRGRRSKRRSAAAIRAAMHCPRSSGHDHVGFVVLSHVPAAPAGAVIGSRAAAGSVRGSCCGASMSSAAARAAAAGAAAAWGGGFGGGGGGGGGFSGGGGSFGGGGAGGSW